MCQSFCYLCGTVYDILEHLCTVSFAVHGDLIYLGQRLCNVLCNFWKCLHDHLDNCGLSIFFHCLCLLIYTFGLCCCLCTNGFCLCKTSCTDTFCFLLSGKSNCLCHGFLCLCILLLLEFLCFCLFLALEQLCLCLLFFTVTICICLCSDFCIKALSCNLNLLLL